MKRTLLLALCTATIGLSASAQTNIANARTYAIGATVTVTGVVTNGAELGSIRYMQDGTAGIAAYGTALSGVNRGDSITVTGPLIEFSGLLEISPASNVINHGPAIVFPAAFQTPILSTGESLESQLIQLDNVSFVQTGNFPAGNGTYQVTDGTNTFDVRVNGSTVIDGAAIPTGQISVRGPEGQFNTNYQIVPRDMADFFPYVAPSEEINVMINGTTYFTGSTYFIGNSPSVPLTIENYGTNVLTITGASFSGTNAAEFTSTILPGSVAGSSNQAYTVTFIATGTGSRFATLSIGNNDSDENPYIIYFEGVGTNNLATEPTANPSALTFPITTAYKIGGAYTAGTGAGKYLVIWKNGSPITGVPADGTTYLRGDVVGDAKVAYVGPGTSFTPRGVIANQTYYFAVYAFNGSGGFENYLTTSPLTGSRTSLGENIGTYYTGINHNSSTFHQSLYSLINPHTSITYFTYKQTIMIDFEVRDTTNGQSMVVCALSGERKVFNDPFDWTPTGYSREHTYAHSWMASFPADNPEQPEYNDQHNLYPANLANANTPRSNLPYDDITGNVVFTYLEGRVGQRAGGQLVYEPRAQHKGNAARSIMYMTTAYGFNLNGNVNAQLEDQDKLREWHFADLPDNYEIARHELVFSNQNNRNPYIDSVDFACFVDFDLFAHKPAGCGNIGLQEQVMNSFVVFPVPSDNVVYVQVNGTEITAYEVIDLNGRVVRSESEVQLPLLTLTKDMIGAGTYIIRVHTPYGDAQQKLIVQ